LFVTFDKSYQKEESPASFFGNFLFPVTGGMPLGMLTPHATCGGDLSTKSFGRARHFKWLPETYGKAVAERRRLRLLERQCVHPYVSRHHRRFRRFP